MKNDDLRGCSLLAVFAHPDDESLTCGGLLAWCAHLGASVSVCCATGGELGSAGMSWISPPGPAEIRRARIHELENAALTLGVANLVVLDQEDGMLPWTDAERLETDLRETICRLHPDVVITFADDGLYGHPDHIALHDRTTAAVAALGNNGPALYYVTMPTGAMRTVVQHVAMASPTILGIDVEAFGACAAAPTLVVDVGPFAARKLAAIKCHRTQVANDALDLLTDADAERLLRTEQFHRASVGRQGETFIERLAVRGVRL